MSFDALLLLAIVVFGILGLIGLEYLRLMHRELRAIKGAVEDTKRYTYAE